MGQANRRGSYEQRKTQAVARREAEIAEADAKADREYAKRTRMKKHMRMAHVGGMGMRDMIFVAAALAGSDARFCSR